MAPWRYPLQSLRAAGLLCRAATRRAATRRAAIRRVVLIVMLFSAIAVLLAVQAGAKHQAMAVPAVASSGTPAAQRTSGSALTVDEVMAAGGRPLVLGRMVAVIRAALVAGRVDHDGFTCALPAGMVSWGTAVVDPGGPVATTGGRLVARWVPGEEHWQIAAGLAVAGVPLRLLHPHFDGTSATSSATCDQLTLEWTWDPERPADEGTCWLHLSADRPDDLSYVLEQGDAARTGRRKMPSDGIMVGGNGVRRITLGFSTGSASAPRLEVVTGIEQLGTAAN